ncbi:MAG: hypothetical protein ACP5NZ_02420 [Nanobdellota archaeon]
MKKRGNKQGLSKLKITAIILVVFILIILIVPIVIKKVFLVGAEDRILGKYTLNLEISGIQVRENNSLLVKLTRGSGKGEFVAINFIIEDDEDKEIVRVNDSLKELQSKLFLLHLEKVNVTNAKKILIDPVFMVGSREESSKNIEDKYIFGSSDLEYLSCMPYCIAGAECGDNGCGEECNGGCFNGSYSCNSNSKCVLNLDTKCSLTNVTVFQVTHIGTNFSVALSRFGKGEDIAGVKLIFTNESGNSTFVIDFEGNLVPLEMSVKYVNISESHMSHPKKIQTMVYFIDELGIEQICRPSNKFYF